jgi:hypothetical protein
MLAALCSQGGAYAELAGDLRRMTNMIDLTMCRLASATARCAIPHTSGDRRRSCRRCREKDAFKSSMAGAMLLRRWVLAPLIAAVVFGLIEDPTLASPRYFGETDSIVVPMPSCNASEYAQIPGSRTLFIGRQLALSDDRLAGLSAPTDCRSIGHKSIWGLTLDELNWTTHKMSVRKILVDTSIDPRTNHSSAVATGGPMRGLIIRSAHDADAVTYHGQVLVSYECTVVNGAPYGVDGTSVCLSVYDPSRQVIDFDRTQVVVSGTHRGGLFYSASDPKLLVFQDRLFVYWSSIAVRQGEGFLGIAIRATELKPTSGGVMVKSTNAPVVSGLDASATTEVWAPDPKDPMGDTTTDVAPLWISGNAIIAMASRGGQGCVHPGGTSPGCFHVEVVRSTQPIGEHIFNRAEKLETLNEKLPSNPQEYIVPIRDPNGDYWFIGHYIKPPSNGYSETKPVPGAQFWRDKANGAGVIVMFPFSDKTYWPTE